MLLFLLGFVGGLNLAVGFIIGFKMRIRFETTGGLLVRPEPNEPIWRTSEQERDLEDRLEAGV